MKKLAITIAIVLGLGLTSFAESDGLFHRSYNAKNGLSGNTYFSGTIKGAGDDPINSPMLPVHGEGTDMPAPLGSGIAVLMGLGAAYLVGKKRREE